MELPLDYIYNEDFEDVRREEEYLGPVPESATAPRKVRVPVGLPSYLAALYDVAVADSRAGIPPVPQDELPEAQGESAS